MLDRRATFERGNRTGAVREVGGFRHTRGQPAEHVDAFPNVCGVVARQTPGDRDEQVPTVTFLQGGDQSLGGVLVPQASPIKLVRRGGGVSRPGIEKTLNISPISLLNKNAEKEVFLGEIHTHTHTFQSKNIKNPTMR